MAETTSHDTEMTRAEMAAFLRSIADELDSDEDVVSVSIGNKAVRLSPSDSIESEATVTERSRRLRKDTEQLALTFKWNPVTDTAEAASEPGSSPNAESDPEMESDAEWDRGTESDRGTEPGTDPDVDR